MCPVADEVADALVQSPKLLDTYQNEQCEELARNLEVVGRLSNGPDAVICLSWRASFSVRCGAALFNMNMNEDSCFCLVTVAAPVSPRLT